MLQKSPLKLDTREIYLVPGSKFLITTKVGRFSTNIRSTHTIA